MKLSHGLVLAAGLVCCAGVAQTQGPGPASLPPGLVRQGDVVTMLPIGEPATGAPADSSFGGERRVPAIRSLSFADHDVFERAVAAALRGNWADARVIASGARDPIVQRLVQWAYVIQKRSGAGFAAIAQFVKDHPDWPGQERILARAEEALAPGTDPHAVILWFGEHAPQTGIGKVRLAEALIATGATSRGRELIRQAWIESNLEPDEDAYVLARHGDALTQDDDREQLERLFARNELSAVRRALPRLSSELRLFAETRLDMRSHPVLGEREVTQLPASLRNDPGILFDEIQLLRQRGDVGGITELLERIPAAEAARWSPSHWWNEINLDARASLKAGFSHEAYRLAAAAALPRAANEYPDAEFLAGWIALRRLGEPQVAATHFANLISVAMRPISKARAHYWLARAYDASGDVRSATLEYRAAAEYPAMFYGQLALARIERNPVLHLPDTPTDAGTARPAYEKEEMTSAIRALADLGLETALREFAVHDAEIHPEAALVKLLAEDLTRMGYREVAVRVAKQASYNGVFLPEYSHPLIVVPRYTGPGAAPETPLVLAIIRQETEFDPDAVSAAGARGIMQVMPDSARHLSALTGLGYNFLDLTMSPAYDMQLGMTELAGDLSEWEGSYVLTTASYNAGRGNARKWVADLGDPRNPLADPVDWIEQIPFYETRNYVQRILENLEVYRSRLSGRDEPLQIMADLYRPAAPPAFSGTTYSETGAAPAPIGKTVPQRQPSGGATPTP